MSSPRSTKPPNNRIAMSDVLARINRLEAEMKSGIEQCRRQLTTTTKVTPENKPVPQQRRSVPAKSPSKAATSKLTRAKSQNDVIEVSSGGEEGMAAIPEELLWKICRNFSAFQLCQARMVCRRWNRVIGSSSLMDKLKIHLPRGSVLKRDCEEVQVLAGSRYCRVVLDRSMILKPSAWWPMVSGSLHTMSLSYCNVTTEELLGMLKETPNLRNLAIDFHFGGNIPEVTFQLSSLKKLSIQSIVEDDSYELFKNLCPGLRTLALPYIDKNCSPKVLDFIRSVGKTLENLSVQGGDDKFWTNLKQEFDQIHLKRFSSGIKDSCQLEKLIMVQPSIEELTVTAVIDPNLELAGYLPNLKRLEIVVKDLPEGKPLLENLQQLEHLKLESIEFSKPELELSWSNDFPNLHSLKLKSFDVKDWSIFFTECSQLKYLKTLQLTSLDATNKAPNLKIPQQNLKTLKISHCRFPSHFIKQLPTALCPNLEEISLDRIPDVTDSVLQKIVQNAKPLRILSLAACKVTEATLEHLIDHGSGALEKVRIWNCGKIPHNSWQRLRKHRNVQVVYKA